MHGHFKSKITISHPACKKPKARPMCQPTVNTLPHQAKPTISMHPTEIDVATVQISGSTSIQAVTCKS